MGAAAPVLIAPVVEIRPRGVDPDLSRFAALIFTSANGVAAVRASGPQAGRPSRAWCVGARTAEAASAAGFRATAAGGDADSLIAAILAAGERGPLLHLRGREARGDIAARLNAAGTPCEEVIVYDQVSVPPSAAAIALLAQPAPVLLPLFSVRSAQRLAKTMSGIEVRAPLRIAAISLSVAEAWAGPAPQQIAISERPEAEAILATLEILAELA